MFTVGPAGTYANEITPALTTYDDYDDDSCTAGGDDYDYYDELALLTERQCPPRTQGLGLTSLP